MEVQAECGQWYWPRPSAAAAPADRNLLTENWPLRLLNHLIRLKFSTVTWKKTTTKKLLCRTPDLWTRFSTLPSLLRERVLGCRQNLEKMVDLSGRACFRLKQHGRWDSKTEECYCTVDVDIRFRKALHQMYLRRQFPWTWLNQVAQLSYTFMWTMRYSLHSYRQQHSWWTRELLKNNFYFHPRNLSHY